MKILQYTLGLPPYRRGGLPRYSKDLSLELVKDKRNEVLMLYPGRIFLKSSNKIFFKNKKTIYPFKVIEMINPLPVSLGLGIDKAAPYMEPRNKKQIQRFLHKVSPNVIHIHTLMGLPLEFLEVAKKLKIKIVFTTHDFYGLCPKMLKHDPKHFLKNRACTFDCMLCKHGPTLKKIKVMQSPLYVYLKDKKIIRLIRKRQKKQLSLNINSKKDPITSLEINDRYKLRLYYQKMFGLIDIFHFNSNVSKEYFKKFLPNTKGKVISISHDGLEDNRNKSRTINNFKIKLGYVGPYDDKKGFFKLSETLCEIRKKTSNFEFHAYGDIIDSPIFKNNWAINHGIIPSNQMAHVYRNIDILILPSLWHETFGFVVLEALLQGTPCLLSTNVGAKDLVPNNWIFYGESELNSKLVKILEHKDILEKMTNKVKTLALPFDMKKHTQRIIYEIYK